VLGRHSNAVVLREQHARWQLGWGRRGGVSIVCECRYIGAFIKSDFRMKNIVAGDIVLKWV
jgi:hypothetical protein